MGLTKYKFGELIELTNEKNANGLYGEEDAIGVNIDKIIMPMRGNLEKKDFSNFHLVPPRHFAYNPRGSRKLGIGFNDTEKTFIITFNDNVFRIKETAKKKILDTYLFMYLCRKEWDRYAEFISWGSSTEVFDWNIFCEEEIFLPPIQIQQKYVDIYNAMLENQKSYEYGLEDLKFACDAYIENLSRCNYGKLGNYIEKNKKRNVKSVFKKSDIKGFNNEGQFIEPMRLFSGDISTFKIVSKDDFVYNSRINSTIKKLSIVINESSDLIVSPAYESFRVIKNNELYPFYLYMLLQRESFARKVLFNSFGSSTIVFGFDDLCEIDIPIPNYSEQKNIANIYRAYKERWNLNEKLKAQIKDICPILIKGSIEEARKAKEA